MDMNVILVRHGAAVPAELDPTRPLSVEGIAQAERVGELLSRTGIAPAAVWTSGKKRAIQTGEILANALCFAGAAEPRKGLSPNGDPEAAREEIEAWGKDLVIAAHIPVLPRLASLLVWGKDDAEPLDFACGAAAILSREGRGRFRLTGLIDPAWLG
jgi:phosphohistidine phosphatase